MASGAVLVALLAIAGDLILALVQRAIVSRGITGRYAKGGAATGAGGCHGRRVHRGGGRPGLSARDRPERPQDEHWPTQRAWFAKDGVQRVPQGERMLRTKMPLGVVVAALALAVTACGGSGDPTTARHRRAAASKTRPPPADTIVVGSANFPESVLLANIYAEALEGQGRQGDARSSTSAAARPTSRPSRTGRST